MRLITVVFFLTSGVVLAQIQKSDYEISKHEIRFLGDEEFLRKVIDPLREFHKEIVFDSVSICEQIVEYIGFIEELNIHIVYLDTSFGISCRRNSKILVFGSYECLGYYGVNFLKTARIYKNKLILISEGNSAHEIDFSKGPPKRVKLTKYFTLEFMDFKNHLGIR